MQGKNVKLHYFDFYGKGEILRFILIHNKIKFEDIRYDYPTWLKVKKTQQFLFYQLPIIEIEGKIYAESHAAAKTYTVSRYLTILLNQYPNDLYDSYYVELTKDYIEEIYEKFIPWFAEKDLKKKEYIHQNFLKKVLPALVPGLNKILKENKISSSGYFVGNYLSLADYIVVEFAARFLIHKDRIMITKPILDANPELAAYLKSKIEGEFREYFKNRKDSFI